MVEALPFAFVDLRLQVPGTLWSTDASTVGGGIVKAPLMNEMGVLPQSIQATAGFMIFFTAGTATISYELYGMLDKTYALPLSLIGFVFNQIGQVIVFHFVERYSRPSLVIFVIGSILSISTIAIAIQGYDHISMEVSCGCKTPFFDDVCSATKTA